MDIWSNRNAAHLYLTTKVAGIRCAYIKEYMDILTLEKFSRNSMMVPEHLINDRYGDYIMYNNDGFDTFDENLRNLMPDTIYLITDVFLIKD